MLTSLVLGLTLWFITGFAFACVFGQVCRLNGLHDPGALGCLHDPSHQVSCFACEQAQLDDYAAKSVT